jgi:hypothetical protein
VAMDPQAIELCEYDNDNHIWHAVMSSMWCNSQGQAVNPLGCDKTVINHSRILCWEHDGNKIMGRVDDITADREHSYVDFSLLDSFEGEPSPGFIGQCLEAGLRFGVSPDYYAIESRKPTAQDKELYGEDTKIVISKWLPVEISLCVVPANLDAYILNSSAKVKGMDRAALGRVFNSVQPATWAKVYAPAPEKPMLTEASVRAMVRRSLEEAAAKKRGRIYV